jgi:hypothetical protein
MLRDAEGLRMIGHFRPARPLSWARPLSRFLLAALCAWAIPTAALPAARAADRVKHDLAALYTFDQTSRGVVSDRAGAAEPLDLHIAKPQAASLHGTRLAVASSTTIAAAKPARAIAAAVKRSGALTIEAWVKPDDTRQNGPARIVTLSADTTHRNFTLSQDGDRYDVRLRTTSTNENGIPSVQTPAASLKTELTHVVFTRDPQGMSRIYLGGREVFARKSAGKLDNWSDDFRLGIGNELTGDRPWLGEFALVALYSQALTASEVAQNFSAGPPSGVDYAALLPPVAARAVDFVKDVQPLLRKHCYECHSAGNEEGGLNLGIRDRAREGGDHGAAFTKGDSAHSRLIHFVAAIDKQIVMPPDGDGDRLSRDEVGILRAWIDQGAPWPDGVDVLDARAEKAKTHWAFQNLRDAALPAVRDTVWCRTPIDRFILARLESANLAPQPPAAPRQLIRRLAFDLTGLPPTPEEVAAFEAAAQADSQAATIALVDRLLASPHYGERWGRHWLDVARYADSDGQESDRDRLTAYHYRDFVIRAFNDDLPFDRFVRWQLAGDEYEPQNPQAVAATGFLAAGPFAAIPDKLMEDERLRNRYNELDDTLSTIGTGFLGLTVGCARCHDHKYDAIPSRDYYRMMCALHSGQRQEVALGATGEKTLGYRDESADPKPTWLFKRGDYYDREHPVKLGFISILTKDKSPQDYLNAARQQSREHHETNQRRALADWIADVDHGAGPLLARVIVNRLWQHHFGQGLVRSMGDFGVRSEPPTHPELLEWLAHDLVDGGWRLKRLQRMIVLSSVYRQSSHRPPIAADPDNRLLSKMPLVRLEGEALRDSMLAASGTLNAALYGPAVRPPIAADAILARNVTDPYPASIKDGPEVRRRSVYLFHKRVVPYPLLQAFDKPDAQQSCGRRDQTTVAPQALALLNDQFVRTVALDFADRLAKECGDDDARAVDRGFQLSISRAASEAERAASCEFIAAQRAARQARSPNAAAAEVRRQALADFCQTMFSLNEFIYVD